jgi:uncharacterized membrane protein YdjX (TVP38/TMEM64 family)
VFDSGRGTGAESTAGVPAGRRGWLKPVVFVVALVAILVAFRVFGLGDRLVELRAWILALGPLGAVVYVLIYGVATTVGLPASVLTVAAGAMFGSVIGVVLVSLGSTLGAAGAFALARWLARDAVSRWLSGNERFRQLDALTERHGAIIVAITRLVPIFPFNLLNYGFGLTRVPFATYLFWSWLCMLPGTVLYVVGADAFTRGLAEGRVPWALLAALAAALVVLVLLVRYARRTLARREAAMPATPATGPTKSPEEPSRPFRR